VKYLQQALAVAANSGSHGLRKLERRAGKVADRLGDDHDLAMLEAKLAALPPRSKAQRKLIARIEVRRAKLQKKAFKLARRIYRGKAAAFVDRVLAG
jgi:CHAD domain-containing protein